MSLYNFTPYMERSDINDGIFDLLENISNIKYVINFLLTDNGEYSFIITIYNEIKFKFNFSVSDYINDKYNIDAAVIHEIFHDGIECDGGITRNYCYNSYINKATNNILESIEFRILDHSFLHESVWKFDTNKIYIRKLTVIDLQNSNKYIYIHKYLDTITVSGLNDNTANIFLNFYFNFYLNDVKFIHDTIVTGAIGTIASDTGLFTSTIFTEPYHFIRQYYFVSSQKNPLILEVILLESPVHNKNTVSKYIYSIKINMVVFFLLETLLNNDNSDKTSTLTNYSGEPIEYIADIIQDNENHFIMQYKFNNSFNFLINLDFSNYTNNKALTTIIRFDKSQSIIGEIKIIDNGEKVSRIDNTSYPR